MYLTLTLIIIIVHIYYYPSLTKRKSLSQPKSPAPGYLPHCFINSNGIANRKTWSQFFPLRVKPPSDITTVTILVSSFEQIKKFPADCFSGMADSLITNRPDSRKFWPLQTFDTMRAAQKNSNRGMLNEVIPSPCTCTYAFSLHSLSSSTSVRILFFKEDRYIL